MKAFCEQGTQNPNVYMKYTIYTGLRAMFGITHLGHALAAVELFEHVMSEA